MSDSSHSDQHSSFRLLVSAKAGDSRAMDSLYRRYLPRLRRWASGRLPRWARDMVNTDDIIQETMMRTLNHVETFQYRGEGAFQAYLRQGLRNRIRDEIRRAQRSPDKDTLGDVWIGNKPSPLEEAIGKEALFNYEEALDRLKPDEREAVVGRVEMGFSYAELARILEKPSPDAARMAVSRALIRLAEEMARGR